ncbi:MAG TPA: polyprenyl synthetase family protein [Bacteroidales bacterium]|nr:polyprenyl synthetase family protein [Bacteroidales bacterium]
MHNDKELFSIINNSLEKISLEEKPENLYAPIKYSIEVGGKRIRPILCLMAAEMFDANYNIAINPAIGIEIFHNFTLLHDDIMDKADMRRGKPTIHYRWNENIALLSGDAMSVIAYKFITESNNLKKVLDVFSETALQICEGQQFDMDFEKTENVLVEDYLKMIKLKTAVLIACSLKIGAITANAPENESIKLYEFGKNLGMAFQLQDDYLDTYGDIEQFGKPIGGDIVANKKTFLLIKSLELANSEQLKSLRYWLKLESFDKAEKISAIRAIFDNLKIADISKKLIDYYFSLAEESLMSINLSEEKKKLLTNFYKSMRYRVS